MINVSDDSEQEGGDDDYEAPLSARPYSFPAFPSSPFGPSPSDSLTLGKGRTTSVSVLNDQ